MYSLRASPLSLPGGVEGIRQFRGHFYRRRIEMPPWQHAVRSKAPNPLVDEGQDGSDTTFVTSVQSSRTFVLRRKPQRRHLRDVTDLMNRTSRGLGNNTTGLIAPASVPSFNRWGVAIERECQLEVRGESNKRNKMAGYLFLTLNRPFALGDNGHRFGL